MVFKLQSLFLCFAAFVATSNGFSIECNSVNQQDWGTGVDLFSAYCNLNFSDNNFKTLTGFTGDFSPKTAADIQVLYLMGAGSPGVDVLPSNLKTLVPNLVIFHWDGARLKHLSAKDFSSWPNLVQVSANNNLLRQLDGNLFSKNPLLKSIDFSMNHIEIIGSGFFNGLTALTSVTFYYNRCSSMMSSRDIEQIKSDLLYVCSKLPAPISNICPAACSARIAAVETQVSTISAEIKTISKFIDLIS